MRHILGLLLFAVTSLLADTDSTRSISFAIVDEETDAPIPDASISYYRQTYQADDQGRIHAPLVIRKHGTYYFVSADGYAPRRISWRSTDPGEYPAEYTVRMGKAVTISGRVQNDLGAPIRGATVFIIGSGSDMGVDVRSFEDKPFVWDEKATTDENGRWTYSAFPAGEDGVSIRIIHPDYASDNSYKHQKIGSFLEGTAVHTLKAGRNISGRILYPNGTPAAGATLFAGDGRTGRSIAETRTDNDGRFTFPPMPGNKHVFTAIKAGWSPAMFTVDSSDVSASPEILLKPGHTVELKVVDPDGHAVEDAWVIPESWLEIPGKSPPDHRYDTLGEISRATHAEGDLRYNKHTDSEGVFRWTWAPEDPVWYSIVKSDWFSARSVSLSPADGIISVTLYPALSVSGRVTDKDTGQDIPAFTVVHATIDDGRQDSFYTQYPVDGKDGRYRMQFQEKSDAFVVRIDAPGYRSVTSRALRFDEGPVVYDAELEPADSLLIATVDARGEPLPRTTVYCIENDTAMVELRGGKIINRGGMIPVETDGAGQARINKPESGFNLVSASASGFGILSGRDALDGKPMRIDPWAKVEVTVTKDGQPKADVPVSAQRNPSAEPKINFFSSLYDGKTDPSGKAVIHFIPPGPVQVGLGVESVDPESGNPVAYFSKFRTFVAKPGETTSVRYDQ